MDQGALLLQEYQPAVRKVSNILRQDKGVVDEMGWDYDDYRQEFSWHAVKTALSFQEKHGFCLPAERRYTHKSLWNRVSNLRREYARKTRIPLVRTCGLLERQDAQGYDMEAQYEARESLKRLADELTAREMDVLLRVAAAGSVCDVRDPILDGKSKTFEGEVRRARAQAKKILDL